MVDTEKFISKLDKMTFVEVNEQGELIANNGFKVSHDLIVKGESDMFCSVQFLLDITYMGQHVMTWGCTKTDQQMVVNWYLHKKWELEGVGQEKDMQTAKWGKKLFKDL